MEMFLAIDDYDDDDVMMTLVLFIVIYCFLLLICLFGFLCLLCYAIMILIVSLLIYNIRTVIPI
jgi:hypothetical protein